MIGLGVGGGRGMHENQPSRHNHFKITGSYLKIHCHPLHEAEVPGSCGQLVERLLISD